MQVIDPPEGSDKADEMLAMARYAGRMSAVVKVKERYYAYSLSEDFDQSNVFWGKELDAYSRVVPLSGSEMVMGAVGDENTPEDLRYAATDIAQVGEPCDAVGLRGCAANLACLNGALVPGCFGSSCCTSVCDISQGDEQCAFFPGTVCRPLFAAPAPEIGRAHV